MEAENNIREIIVESNDKYQDFGNINFLENKVYKCLVEAVIDNDRSIIKSNDENAIFDNIFLKNDVYE